MARRSARQERTDPARDTGAIGPASRRAPRGEGPPAASASAPDRYLALQRVAGNEAVTRLLEDGDGPSRGTHAVEGRIARGFASSVQRWAWPWESEPEPADAKARLRRLLINPERSPDAALALVDDADVDLLADIREFTDTTRVAQLAGSDAGRRILARVAERFDRAKRWDLHKPIQEVLDRHDDSGAVVFRSTQDAIDVINHAIEGEDGFLRMLYGDWLRLPVRQYRSGAEEDGGLYYDPSLTDKSSTVDEGEHTAHGKTEAIEWVPEPEQGLPEARVPVIYTRFGPGILTGLKAAADKDAVDAAEAYLRSTVYHEFRHFLDYRKLRDPAMTLDERRRITLEPNAETRAYSSQLLRYYGSLAEPDVRNLLTELSRFFRLADDDVRDEAVSLIVAAVRERDLPGAMAYEELLGTMNNLSPQAQKVLAPLKAKLVAGKDAIETKERLFESAGR